MGIDGVKIEQNYHVEVTPVQELCNAVIKQACDDYAEYVCIKHLKCTDGQSFMRSKNTAIHLASANTFLHNKELFALYSKMDPSYLTNKIEKLCELANYSYKCYKELIHGSRKCYIVVNDNKQGKALAHLLAFDLRNGCKNCYGGSVYIQKKHTLSQVRKYASSVKDPSWHDVFISYHDDTTKKNRGVYTISFIPKDIYESETNSVVFSSYTIGDVCKQNNESYVLKKAYQKSMSAIESYIASL